MLYVLDYGAGSESLEPMSKRKTLTLTPRFSKDVRSLANSIKKLGYDFKWVSQPSDLEKASVSVHI